MSKIKNKVEELCGAKEALDKFLNDEKNKAIFAEYEVFQQRINELTDEVKNLSREELIDTETDKIRVSVSRKFKSWYEPSLLDLKSIKTLKENNGIKTEVVKSVLEDLVKKGEISREASAKAFKEEEQTPAVLLKWKT